MPGVQAVQDLRQGMADFREALGELQEFAKDGRPVHLTTGSRLLVPACDGRAEVIAAEIRHEFLAPDKAAGDITTRHGTFAHYGITSDESMVFVEALHKRMAELEAEVARAAAVGPDDLLITDGPLSGRRHGVKQIAYLVVARYRRNPKQTLGIVTALVQAHLALIGQKRRGLREKHSKGAQTGIAHRVLLVVASLAHVGKPLCTSSQSAHKFIEHGAPPKHVFYTQSETAPAICSAPNLMPVSN